MKALLIWGVVVLVVFGLLLTLRTSRNAGMPSAEVLERAARRARELSQAEDDESRRRADDKSGD